MVEFKEYKNLVLPKGIPRRQYFFRPNDVNIYIFFLFSDLQGNHSQIAHPLAIKEEKFEIFRQITVDRAIFFKKYSPTIPLSMS